MANGTRTGFIPLLLFMLLPMNHSAEEPYVHSTAMQRADDSRFHFAFSEDGMADATRTHFLLLVLFVLVPLIHSADEPCAFLEFPTLSGDTVTSREGSNLTLPFKITFTRPCPEGTFEILRVLIGKNDDDDIRIVCGIVSIDGVCEGSVGSSCGCGSAEFTYQFKSTLGRRDSGTWIWLPLSAEVKSKTLYFSIQ
ncbi:hypothetical protein BaRGS_00003572, partial [Batillaria attramentaria]